MYLISTTHSSLISLLLFFGVVFVLDSPIALREHYRRMLGIAPLMDLLKVLLITTQGRPTHLTCGQSVLRIIILRPGSWQKGQLPPLSGQKGSLEATTQAAIPLGSGSCAAACHGAFSIVARLDGNVPAWLVLTFQATG